MEGTGINIKFKKDAMVFIDGNNFYHNLIAMKINPSYIDFSKLSEFVCRHFGYNHKKTFYYNSIPKLEDGKVRYWKSMKFFERMEKLPKFEVKKRKLQRTSTHEQRKEKEETISSLDLCETCRPIVEANCNDCIGNIKTKEKGVDVMIAVDMLEQGVIKNNCDACICISGDADFIPAMSIIKGNGTQAFSASLTKGYSLDLRRKNKYLILSKDLIETDCF